VSRYDETGELTEAGTWTADGEGRWLKCAD
jgi:hypothetical protein